MDINNISSHIKSQLSEAGAADPGEKLKSVSAKHNSAEVADKVSIDSYNFKTNVEKFAKMELEKLNHTSFEKLKLMKAKLVEFENAKALSPDQAAETEIGKLLNNPDIWGEIANRMLE
ncbi:MAG: hypothetical protein EA360_03360 [Balneolaceae bacterium]|nr:MAG: hypothetical protein EA360_03360 [Balneolaceae bacterium]